MHNFTPFSSLVGGLLIGLSTTLMLLFKGRITGISGILAGVFPLGDRGWRLLFLGALVGTSSLIGLVTPEAFGVGDAPSWPVMLSAGFLVGIGTRMGSGCTSGHGVCGLPRLSLRSLVATFTFIFAGGLTVVVVRQLTFGAT